MFQSPPSSNFSPIITMLVCSNIFNQVRGGSFLRDMQHIETWQDLVKTHEIRQQIYIFGHLPLLISLWQRRLTIRILYFNYVTLVETPGEGRDHHWIGFTPQFGINSPSDCEAPVAAGAKHSTTHRRVEVAARYILSWDWDKGTLSVDRFLLV